MGFRHVSVMSQVSRKKMSRVRIVTLKLSVHSIYTHFHHSNIFTRAILFPCMPFAPPPLWGGARMVFAHPIYPCCCAPPLCTCPLCCCAPSAPSLAPLPPLHACSVAHMQRAREGGHTRAPFTPLHASGECGQGAQTMFVCTPPPWLPRCHRLTRAPPLVCPRPPPS